MAKKTKKGAQSSRLQQQQQAAAKRRIVAEMRPARQTPQPQHQDSPEPSGEERGGQRLYLDVSAVRIQDWLARTTDLRFRRGASTLLTKATARADIENTLPAGVSWNNEAGSVDGVISLVADPGVDAEALETAARRVAVNMRALVPYCPIQAVAAAGDSYASAYAVMELARRDGQFVVDAPPAAAELIMAKPCDECRAAPAIHATVRVIHDEDPVALCGECMARSEAAEGTRKGRPLPELKLMQALKQAGMPVKDFADHVAETAAGGQRDQDDAATQVALICADGNRVGPFLTSAAECARNTGRPGKYEIVPAVDDATIGALADAVIACFPGNERPPLVASIAGGDDLLVTVPAGVAWQFTRTLLSAFTRRLTEAAAKWPAAARRDIPTLSAAIVFDYYKHPFADQLRFARAQLTDAKKAVDGRTAAASFLDLTADGTTPPPDRVPIPLTGLDQRAGHLDQIITLPASRRQTLLTLLRQGDRDEVTRRLTDLDNRPLWEAVAGRRAGPEQTRAELRDNPAAFTELRLLLDIARHWQPRPAPTAAQETGSQGSSGAA